MRKVTVQLKPRLRSSHWQQTPPSSSSDNNCASKRSASKMGSGAHSPESTAMTPCPKRMIAQCPQPPQATSAPLRACRWTRDLACSHLPPPPSPRGGPLPNPKQLVHARKDAAAQLRCRIQGTLWGDVVQVGGVGLVAMVLGVGVPKGEEEVFCLAHVQASHGACRWTPSEACPPSATQWCLTGSPTCEFLAHNKLLIEEITRHALEQIGQKLHHCSHT